MVSNFELVAYIGAVNSLLIACALVYLPEGNATSNRLLAALLSVSGCYLLMAGIGSRPELIACSLNELFSFIALGFGPLLWLYVRSITHNEFKFSHRQWLHLLPAFPCLVIILYDLGGELCNASPRGAVGSIITAAVIVSMSGYSILALGELKRHQQDVKEVVSTVEWNYVVWLRLFIFTVFAYIAFGVVAAVLWEVQAIPLLGAGLRVAVFNYLLFYLVVAEALFHPEIFSRRYVELLRLKEQRLVNPEDKLQEKAAKKAGSKYERSGLSDEMLKAYWQRANQYLEDNRPYLQSDLRISLLADAMGISINHLSQAINVVGGTSFYDLVNTYRIEYAKRLLGDAKQDYKSVIDIGLDAGFNSQSAFYKAFNRIAGTTPAKFRKARVTV